MNTFSGNRYINSFEETRELARKKLPKFIFEYIDGSAGTEYGENNNRQKLKEIQLKPEILKNISNISTKQKFLGENIQLPFGIAPMGMCQFVHPRADRYLACLGRDREIPICVSTVASESLENYWELSEGNAWFQLYVHSDINFAIALVKRAKNVGYKKIILTVDVPALGRRPREEIAGFKVPFKLTPQTFLDCALHPKWSISNLLAGVPQPGNFGKNAFDRSGGRGINDWKFLKKLRDLWKGELILKGILNVEDSVKAVSFGVDAIQVSGHGGRQLDSMPAPIEMLYQIKKELKNKCRIIFDTGIRSGEDVVKAYSLGADFVMIGRPALMAMAAYEKTGLYEMVDLINHETGITMAQLGKTIMSDLSMKNVFRTPFQ